MPAPPPTLISIIIPLRTDIGYLQPCLQACSVWTDVEIVVLPDEWIPHLPPSVLQIVTGPISPARKRNTGAAQSRGALLAFLDDDTRPQPGWLENVRPYFTDPQIAAVGGPAVTPPDDPFWARVGGAVYSSWLFSGPARHRYFPTRRQDVDDFPSCNLIVRRLAFDAVGGFRTDFWPGEDTAFCLELIQKGYRIVYEPRALIEHHRRPHIAKHFQQLTNYALHRGYFAKRYPQTSRRGVYFVPSLFLTGLLLLVFASLAGVMVAGTFLGVLLLLYFLLALLSVVSQPVIYWLPAVVMIFLSHLAYGGYFLIGLCRARLPEEG